MKKLITLKTLKRHYHKKLDKFVEAATTEEINKFVNTIHNGASKKGCGKWSEDQRTFSSCDDENCQMLSECLEVNATVNRPEFFTFAFDGNTQQEKMKQLRKKIGHEYYQQLEPKTAEDQLKQLAFAYHQTMKEDWSTMIEFSFLMSKKMDCHDN